MDQNDTIPESPNQFATVDNRTQQEWGRKLSLGRDGPPRRRYLSEARSIASDPAELVSNGGFPMATDGYFDAIDRRDHAERTILKDQDADDELVTNDEDEDEEATAPSRHSNSRSRRDETEDYFKTPVATRFNDHTIPSSLDTSRSLIHQQATSKRTGLHSRTMSTNTILYNPPKTARRIPDEEEVSPGAVKTRSRPISTRPTPVDSPIQRSPRRTGYLGSSRPRPIMPPRDAMHTAPNIHRLGNGLAIDTAGPRRGKTRRMSSSDLLEIQSDLAGVADHDAFGGVPSSFVTQMAMATGMMTPGAHRANEKAQRERDNDRDRMSRLVLARMKTLEEGFADVVKGMRGLQRSSAMPSTAQNSASEGTGSSSWHGEGEVIMRPFTNLVDGGRRTGIDSAGKRSKAGSNGKPNGSRPGSRRGGNKSNRNSVILRSPVSSRGGDLKGKGRQVAMPREDSDSDMAAFGDIERVGLTRRGSSV